MRLRHLNTDWPTAYDGQMIRLFQIVEDRFVGVEWQAVQAGNRWHHGGRPGGDDKEFRGYLDAVRPDAPRRDETRPLLNHRDAKAGKSFDRIMRGDGGDGVGNMRLYRREIHLRRCTGHAHRRIAAGLMSCFRRCQHSLGGNTAAVQTVTAHSFSLEKHHPRAHLRRPGGDAQTARSSANDAYIRGDLFHDEVSFRSATQIRRHATGSNASRPSAANGPRTAGEPRTCRSGTLPAPRM